MVPLAAKAAVGAAAIGGAVAIANARFGADMTEARIDDLVCIMFHENSKGIAEERTGFVWVTLNRFRHYGNWDKAIKSLSATPDMYRDIQRRVIWGRNIFDNAAYAQFKDECKDTFARHNAWLASGGKVDGHIVGERFNWIHVGTQTALKRKVPSWARKEPIVVGICTFSNPLKIIKNA